MIMGIIKIALAGFLISMLNLFSNIANDVQVGGVILPVGTIIRLIIAFFPLLLLISAMKDLGISI
ncbi:MAG: hypothetical protein QW607_06735 [Desulfurococcaceae archaeon]